MDDRTIELHNVAETASGPARTLFNEKSLATALKYKVFAAPAEWPCDGEGGSWLSRVPMDLRSRLNPLAHLNAVATSGCEVRTVPRGAGGAVTLRSPEGAAEAEVWRGCFPERTVRIETTPTRVELTPSADLERLGRVSADEALAFDPALCRILLPHGAYLQLLGVEGDLHPPEPGQTPALTMLAYGSSITQGAAARRPSGPYAMRAAQHMGLDLLNFGFGGGALMETELAAYLVGRSDWHFATCELGINAICDWTPEEFRAGVRAFLAPFAEDPAGRPVAVMDLFPSKFDLSDWGRPAAFRAVVAEEVARLGIDRVVHLPAMEILPHRRGLSADLLHPAPEAMEEMGLRLAERLRELPALQPVFADGPAARPLEPTPPSP